MVEWLILLVLVPAVVVPVVMLVGFAGCHVAFGLDDDLTPLPPVPRIAAAEGASISSIALTILYEPDVQGFEFERKQLPEQTLESFQVDASTIDTFTRIDASNYRVIDSELIRAKDYLYRVRAIDIDGEYSRWSALEPNVPAATLDFRTTFEWTPDEKQRRGMRMPGKGSALCRASPRTGCPQAARMSESHFARLRREALPSKESTYRNPTVDREWTRTIPRPT